MTQSERDIAEARARSRFVLLTALRFGGIAMVMIGFAGMRGVVPLDRIGSVIFVLAGVADFFFAPRLLARRWKAEDESGR